MLRRSATDAEGLVLRTTGKILIEPGAQRRGYGGEPRALAARWDCRIGRYGRALKLLAL